MTNLRQAAQQALEALESWERVAPDLSLPEYDQAIITLRTALEQQAEPVAWRYRGNMDECVRAIEAKLKERNT